jgi:hypothetical protein
MIGAEIEGSPPGGVHGPGTQPPYCLGWVANVEDVRPLDTGAWREKTPAAPNSPSAAMDIPPLR